MRWSRAFLPVLKESPADAQIVSHKLMLRAGLVRQTAAGIYAWLPLGYRVLRKIEQIVREEQDRAGAIEMLMPTLQSAELWRKRPIRRLWARDAADPRSARARDPVRPDERGDDHRSLPRRGQELSRPPADALSHPVEVPGRGQPRFGVMRGREFLMKDAYSFDLDEAGARLSYYTQMLAYLRTFQRMGIRAVPMKAASGPIGGDLSHEFIVLAPTGESEVFYDASFEEIDWNQSDVEYGDERGLRRLFDQVSSTYAATDETHDELEQGRRGQAPHRPRHRSRPHLRRQIFGSDGAEGLGPDGHPVTPLMGSYGVGVSRLVAAIIEASHDERHRLAGSRSRRGAWASSPCAPTMRRAAERTVFTSSFDRCWRGHLVRRSRRTRWCEALASMDLIGVAWQLIVGPRGIAAGTVELKKRATGEKQDLG